MGKIGGKKEDGDLDIKIKRDRFGWVLRKRVGGVGEWG